VVQLLLLTGSRRWLARAREDVDAAVDVVQLGEVLRAAHAEDLAARLGLAEDASLAELAAVSPEPWHTSFGQQRAELRSLYAQVQEVAPDTEQLSLLTFLR
ncbi:MAG TPA: hypothetical protein VKB75_15285, partial [Jatrophihabitans sp.]|nr:hypothetical protein [Jatrophihabitans sp.]